MGKIEKIKNLSDLGSENSASKSRQMLNKVPQVTIFFWIIKVLCTTVGETASDFLNVNLGFGLTGTSIVMGILLAIVLFCQFRAKKYIPGLYWMSVVLISIFGTLVTDNLTDAMGVPLEVSTIVFSVALAITFAVWYSKEKTLSIHSIFTSKREAFYWLTILFTFALGTASGDLMAESLGLGYLVTGLIVVGVVVAVSVAWKFGLDSVLSFWIVYIMTRPLGASLGDYLSQPHKYGGLGLGATITTVVFVGAILLTVIFLAVTKVDVNAKLKAEAEMESPDTKRRPVMPQVIAVACILVLLAGTGYYWRHSALSAENATSAAQASTSDSSSQTSTTDGYASIIQTEEDMLSLVNNSDMSGAKTGADDLEYTWDQAAATLKPQGKTKWDNVDKTIDTVLRDVRSTKPDTDACKTALETSIAAMK